MSQLILVLSGLIYISSAGFSDLILREKSIGDQGLISWKLTFVPVRNIGLYCLCLSFLLVCQLW